MSPTEFNHTNSGYELFVFVTIAFPLLSSLQKILFVSTSGLHGGSKSKNSQTVMLHPLSSTILSQ